MTRALSLILGLLMLVQLIYPLGLPGLKRRADAWKIAVLALALILAIATLRPPHNGASPVGGWLPARTPSPKASAGSFPVHHTNDGTARQARERYAETGSEG